MSGSDRNQHHRPDQNPYSHSQIVDKQQDMTRQFPQYAHGWQQPQPQENYHQLPPLTGSGQFVASPQSQYGPAGPQYDYQYSQRASSYTPDMDVEMSGGRPGSYDSNRRRYGHDTSSTPRGFHTYPHLPPPNQNESFTSHSQQWLSPSGTQQPPPQQQPQTQPQAQPSTATNQPKNLRHLPGSLMDQDPHWENISQQGGMGGQQNEPQHRCMVGQPGMPEPAPSRGAKQRFTPEDDELLRKLKEEHNLSWTQIADFFPDRRSGTLQVRYCTKIKKREENWSEDNINKLRTVVDDIRSEFWTQVSGRVGKGFTPQSCRDKWEELEAIDRENERVRLEQEATLPHQHDAVKREYYSYRT